MKDKKCIKCGNSVKKDLITYKTKVWDEIIKIPMIEGYECAECGHIGVDKKVEERLNVKILEKKLEMYRQEKVKIIQINNVRDIRTDKGISQGKLGDALDFTEQRFGAIERNDNTPTVYLAGVIAMLLGVDMNDLYQFEFIPIKVFLELENLDEEFNVIKGLPEARKNYYEAIDTQRTLRDEANELKVKRRRIAKRIDDKKKKLNGLQDENEQKELLKEIDTLNKEIDKLDEDIKFYDGEDVEIVLERKRKELENADNLSVEEVKALKTKIKELEDVERKNKRRKKPKKVEGKLDEIAEVVSKYLTQVRKLEKKGNAVLKQGHCLSGKHWKETKKRYSEHLKVGL